MAKKKVLIITYYWPPAGGPGVQRWLKFVKYLPEYDIDPIVYCPKNPNYAIIDESLSSGIPKEVTIIKQPIREPYRLASLLSKKSSKEISSGVIPKQEKQTFIQKLLLYVRGNFFIPDARKNWVKPSVKYLSDYIKKEQIETIITTGPPHSLHLIGLQLKEQLGVKWIADFRDPWTTIGYHKKLKLSKSSQKKHKQFEHDVLNAANQIIVTSENTKQEFALKTNKPITVITNGYDTHHIEKPVKDSKFTLSHIGSLLSERNPKQLWEALSELINENESFNKSFQLNLIGVVSEDVIQTLKNFKLSHHINNVGYVLHDEALKAQMQSRVLLMVEINSEDTKAIIPGKLFEYMASHTPIIAVGPNDTDVERIIKSTNTGRYFYYNQKEEIKSQILSYFEAYKSNTLTTQPIGLQQYSRKALTKLVSQLI
ncbi:glycosyltransferase family 4 protein [Ichthyenterobacterium magnum]|uniref:Glycosyltransferase involved in cell wall biosynthesis n=1 Tax=Ichthyenterobacterium magnum TaxID=1230530 RepID=A0A420DM35_9FLAO|nr:glycosyltransferase family 4 protein [Ichthyenterobacterium magnum]RKE95237.1 glycosyltransferase involved in cell wall biosynthesis [Ichthyenterobacterium magnum]